MEKFKHLLSVIGKTLKTHGFTKKGNTFYLLKEGNWGVINFQKSTSSSKESIKFTINLGIQSTAISEMLTNRSRVVCPKIYDCHWSERIGFLLPKQQDYWWTINDSTVLEELINEISNVISEFAVIVVMAHISDESLKLQWLSGTAPGCTELQRYIYLTTILKLSHDERLQDVIDDLIVYSTGRPYENKATAHIKRLELYGK